MPAELDKERFSAFVDLLREKLEVGAREYGDVSFERNSSELIAEIREELLDVCGWSFVLLQRLDGIAADLRRVDP